MSSGLRHVRKAVRHRVGLVRSNPSNDGAFGRRLARVARFELASFIGRETIVPFGAHARVRARKAGDSSQRAVYAALPDYLEMRLWQQWLSPGDRFVDVGANVGLYSLLAAGTGADVLAIEPAADMAVRLRDNIALSRLETKIRVIEAAAMDQRGNCSLDGPDPNRRATRTQIDGAIPCCTLDELLGQSGARGIKVDVEGNERLVIQGAENHMRSQTIELVQLEWNETCELALAEDRRPVADLLMSFGYVLFRPQAEAAGAMGVERLRSEEVDGYGADVFAIPENRWTELLTCLRGSST